MGILILPSSIFLFVVNRKRDPRTLVVSLRFQYLPNRQVPLLVPEAAARRAESSSRLAGPTRHPMGSQD